MRPDILLLALGFVFALAVIRRRTLGGRPGGGTAEVRADAAGVRRTLRDGRLETVAWDEVTEIDVFTTRVGPHRESGGALVLYGDETRGCIVPLDRLGESGVLEHASRLPGFDTRRVIEAVNNADRESGGGRADLAARGSRARPRTTVCWTRRPTAGSGGGA